MASVDQSQTGFERPLALRRRTDLEAVPQTFAGRAYWAVKDPVRLKYFHLNDEEYCVFEALDGTASLAGIREKFERRFAPRRLALAQIQSFLGQLHQEGLILADARGQSHELLERGRLQRWRARASGLSNVLAIRFRGFDPQRFLDWLAPRCQWLFSRGTLSVSFFIVILAMALVASHFGAVTARLPDLNSLLDPSTVLCLSLALALVKVLHELGHALACRHFGGECHEMGLLLLVFTPCLYCNVSDAWMIESKWKRAAIGAAGVCVELVLAAVCTFLWWFSEPGLLNTLCLNVMLVSSVNTLIFNGNPLMRYDGYFVLSDIVEVPNLAQEAATVLRDTVVELALGVPAQQAAEHSPVQRGLLSLYAIASALYRAVVICGILWFVRSTLKPYRLEMLADILAVIVLGGLVAGPLRRTATHFKQAYGNRQMKFRRALASGLTAIFGLGAFLLVPFPHRVAAPAMVEPGSARHVYVAIAGTIVRGAQSGEQVRENEPVAVLENLDLQLEIARLQGQRNEQKLHLANLKHRQTRDTAAAAQIPTAEEALADLDERLERRIDDEKRLVVRAPASGTILPVRQKPRSYATGELETWSGLPLDEANRGSRLETGTLLCQIGDPARLEASVVLDQRDVEFVRAGQEVRVQLDQSPDRVLSGTIVEVAEIDLKVTPAELLPEGSVPTRQDESGVPRPVSTMYQARVSLANTDSSILIGQAGRAKIYTAPMSLAKRLSRYLSHTFRFEW
jgi:putative peptide zinc metalloprotease protein